MRTQEYLDLIERQRKEINEFPIAYAFDEKQLEEALKKLGATKMDNHEYAINYSGDEDALGCFGLEMDELEELGLSDVYMLARKRHFDHMREWGVL